VTSFLSRAAQLYPLRTAVEHPGGTISYTDLRRRVLALAAALSERVSNEAVGILTEHDPATPELYLGVMASGNAVVPLSRRLPDESVAKIARAAGLRLIIVAPEERARRAAIESACDGVVVVDYPDLTIPPLPRDVTNVDAGVAMISFTSGTTGAPKGVMLTHTNLLVHGLTAAHTYRLDDVNVTVNAMPMAHFAGASRVILGIVNAGTHVILPRFEPAGLLEAIVGSGGTHTMIVPTMAADLLALDLERYDLHDLSLIYGAAPMPMEVAAELQDRLGCNLYNGYGLTESTALATAFGPAAHRQAVKLGDDELLKSVGGAVAGVEVKIIDQDGATVPSGTVGQIALRGLKISPGYFANPEQTARTFVDGWLLTGDLGSMADGGLLHLHGRADDMIITGGMNVQPQEVEEALRDLEGVVECAAFWVPSDRWGQEVRLAVVTSPGYQIDIDRVKQHLSGKLDPFKVPKVVHAVGELPKTPLGKLQRRRLTQQFTVTPNEALLPNGGPRG
jgi:long-chain acyl-CoA synthetase